MKLAARSIRQGEQMHAKLQYVRTRRSDAKEERGTSAAEMVALRLPWQLRDEAVRADGCTSSASLITQVSTTGEAHGVPGPRGDAPGSRARIATIGCVECSGLGGQAK